MVTKLPKMKTPPEPKPPVLLACIALAALVLTVGLVAYGIKHRSRARPGKVSNGRLLLNSIFELQQTYSQSDLDGNGVADYATQEDFEIHRLVPGRHFNGNSGYKVQIFVSKKQPTVKWFATATAVHDGSPHLAVDYMGTIKSRYDRPYQLTDDYLRPRAHLAEDQNREH